MKRVAILSFAKTPFSDDFIEKNPNDFPDTLVLPILKTALNNSKISSNLVEEIAISNVLNTGEAIFQGRFAGIACGIKIEVPVIGINRHCASGLDAIDYIATRIKLGDIKVGVALGYELTSKDDHYKSNFSIDGPFNKLLLTNFAERAEFLAHKFNFTERICNKYVLNSKEDVKKLNINFFAESKKFENSSNSCFERLSTIAHESDCASAVVLCDESLLEELNLTAIGYFHDFVSVGFNPDYSNGGAAIAVKKLMERNGLTDEKIGFYEIIEPSAAEALQIISELNLDFNKVNLKGGTLKFGHSFGATGISMCGMGLLTGNKNIGIVCISTSCGIGVAALIENCS